MLSELRAQIEQPGVVYLDHALRGPLPRAALEAGRRALADARNGSRARASQAEAIATVRAQLGNLLGWPQAGLAFMQNTTHAIAALAQSLEWLPGDAVLLHADEVPGNVLPWRALERQGVEVRLLPSRVGRLDLDDLDRALVDPTVRVVSLAAVALPTGERRDLTAIGRRVQAADAWFVVDVAQSAGALAMDLTHADAVAGSTRKWLLGPPDIGFLGVRPDRLGEVKPAQAGLASLTPDGHWREDARRYEGGALPAVLFAPLAASLELLGAVDPDTREREVLARATEVAAVGAQAGWQTTSPQDEARSGVVYLTHPEPHPGLPRALEAAGIVARWTRTGLRVSAHAWNTRAEIEALGEALESM